MPIAITGTTLIHKGFTTLTRVTVQDGEASFGREIEDHGQAASVLPFDPERKVALVVSLPRIPVHLAGLPDILEAPAGLRGGGEEADVCVRREALEEVGVRLGALAPVAVAWSSPGISTERLSLYLAAYALDDRIASGGGLAEENEAITVHEIALGTLAAMADAGTLTDMKTLCLVQTLRLRRPELF